MRKYITLGAWAIVIYFGIASYGSTREFESALNASEVVTPLMLKESFEAIQANMLFLGILLLLQKHI